MTPDESVFARRWATRRFANGHEPNHPVPSNSVSLTAAMRLLSDYEDAIFSSCRHAVVPAGQAPDAESEHLVEATRLHADVRRLRLEVLELMEASENT